MSQVVASSDPLAPVELESCCTNHLVKRIHPANGELPRELPFEMEKGASPVGILEGLADSRCLSGQLALTILHRKGTLHIFPPK